MIYNRLEVMALSSKTIFLNKERNVTLTPYIVSKKTTPAVLILPGGAYNNCTESEGKPVAKTLNKLGFNCFILCYSVGEHYKWPRPLEDYEQAMEYICANAEKYSVDKEHIVVMGFSAGGHLASAAASLAVHKPFAAVLCYAPTTAATLAHCAPDAPDTCEAVNHNTCPCFIASSRNDWIVPSFNTTKFVDALQKNYVDYEAHIYGYSMHGFSVGEPANAVGPMFCSRVGDWVNEFVSWIDDLISGRYVSIRECCEYNDQHSDTLTTANSCPVVFADSEVEKQIRKKFPVQYLLYAATKKKLPDFIKTISPRNIFQLMHVKSETIAKMDDLLKQYKR